MNWTRTDAARRWIVVTGLILGPVLLVLSVAINFSGPSDSMRADFAAMGKHPALIIAEALLETAGFMIVLAALAGSTSALRARGGALGTWGAVLSILGIVGFSLSNANGFTLAQLAVLPDHDAAFATAIAMMGGSVSGTAVMIGIVLETLAQIGIVLVIIGFIRARLAPIWLLLPVIAGIVINIVGGIMLTTLIADVLLLATTTVLAIRLARSSRGAWLGMPADAPEPASVTM